MEPSVPRNCCLCFLRPVPVPISSSYCFYLFYQGPRSVPSLVLLKPRHHLLVQLISSSCSCQLLGQIFLRAFTRIPECAPCQVLPHAQTHAHTHPELCNTHIHKCINSMNVHNTYTTHTNTHSQIHTYNPQASQVAQRQRIHLPVQETLGTWV